MENRNKPKHTAIYTLHKTISLVKTYNHVSKYLTHLPPLCSDPGDNKWKLCRNQYICNRTGLSLFVRKVMKNIVLVKYLIYRTYGWVTQMTVSGRIIDMPNDLNKLSHKQIKTHGCVLSTVSTDVLVLKHQSTSTHRVDCIDQKAIAWPDSDKSVKIMVNIVKKFN